MGINLTEDSKRMLLFDGPGLDFTHQVMNLVKGIALSSSSTGSTANEQVFITHQLLSSISIALNDKNLCADLLEEILQCGWTSVSCYWQGSSGGTNIQPLVLFLVQVTILLLVSYPLTYSLPLSLSLSLTTFLSLFKIFVGCMHPAVPPQDALISTEGLINMNDSRGLFKLSWFQEQCFDHIIDSSLKVCIDCISLFL